MNLRVITDTSLEKLCQDRTNNDGTSVVSKIIKIAANQLVQNIRRLRVQSRIDAVKINSGVFKSRAGAHRPAQDRGTGNDIRKLPAHSHDFIGVSDALKIETASHTSFGALRGNHERLVAWSKTRSDDQRAIATDG